MITSFNISKRESNDKIKKKIIRCGCCPELYNSRWIDVIDYPRSLGGKFTAAYDSLVLALPLSSPIYNMQLSFLISEVQWAVAVDN